MKNINLSWKSLISENRKDISQGRFWLNILLLLSIYIWIFKDDIPVGLGSLIGTLLLYNYGKKLKITKNQIEPSIGDNNDSRISS